jgi:hypothetical protein
MEMPTPVAIIDRLSSFAASEHLLYQWPEGNFLWLALDEIVRYRRFVEIIVSRIDDDRELLNSATEASVQGLRNYAGGPISAQQQSLDERAIEAQVPVHLDIESLYLFAKVLLDRTAISIGVFFGQAQSCSLASHDSWRKSLAKYATAKGLSLPPRLEQLVENLQRDVAFRDKQLVHRQVGATRGTSWNMENRSAQILIQPDKQSKDPVALVRAIDEYLDLVVVLFETNREGSHLRPR